jgi:hypothetical protein
VKKRGDRSHTSGARGGSPGCAEKVPQVLIALVLVVSCIWRERATLPRGFILSPSATLRVAGLALWVKVEHTTV